MSDPGITGTNGLYGIVNSPVALSVFRKLVWTVPGTVNVSLPSMVKGTFGWVHEDPILWSEPDIDSGDVILVKCEHVLCFVCETNAQTVRENKTRQYEKTTSKEVIKREICPVNVWIACVLFCT